MYTNQHAYIFNTHQGWSTNVLSCIMGIAGSSFLGILTHIRDLKVGHRSFCCIESDYYYLFFYATREPPDFMEWNCWITPLKTLRNALQTPLFSV